jgi:hypothetical protein
LTHLLVGPASLGALALLGCFGSEPDDSPYTVHRGESIESIQLEIEPDGTPVIMSLVGMYMAHNNPHPDNPWEFQVSPQNFRSVLHRRSTGGWSATDFKNLQNSPGSLPTLIPDPEGRFQAFISDGGEVKRFAFGNGTWNRAAGTEWPVWFDQWVGLGGGPNWNRHPRIAVAGTNLLLTVHNDWWSGKYWVMEGKERRVELPDSLGADPLAFHVGAGYRCLVARVYTAQERGIGEGSGQELHLYRWTQGAHRAELQVLGRFDFSGDTFFARHRGGTALYVSAMDSVRIFTLDDSGRVAGRDGVPLPAQTGMPFLAADTAGCLHALSWLPDSGTASIRFGHWNACAPVDMDTLSLPKPGPAETLTANRANLRIAPDGTPVAAVLLREMRPANPLVKDPVPVENQGWSDPTFLYLAELRAGAWSLEKVYERRPAVAP